MTLKHAVATVALLALAGCANNPFNRAAQEAGAKAFHAEIYGEEVSYLSRPYPERSRQMIVDRITGLEDSGTVAQWLAQYDLADCFS